MLIQRSLRKVLIDEFFWRRLIFSSIHELIDFFEIIGADQASFSVPYHEDPEFPTVYATTVAQRLRKAIEQVPDHLVNPAP